jgi:hypothetical protein
VPLAQVARLGNGGVAFGMVMLSGLAVGLEASAYFTPSQAGYSSSAHVCILDVDTGEVQIVRYVVGHDCGNVINPLLVEGQILGGVAHGLSNALYEEAFYDEQGQNLAASFLDYPLPSAREMPRIELFHLLSPSPRPSLGERGSAEDLHGRRRHPLRRQILEWDAATAPERFSRLCDSPQELGMVLQSIVEPVVLTFEADQHTGRLPVPRDENLLGLGQAQESRQVVLDLSQRRPAHRASRARQANSLLRLS